MYNIASSVTLPRPLLAAGAVAALVCLPAALVIPYGAIQLPANPAFLPAFGAATFLADLITAALLFNQARAAQDRGIINLAVAYLFSCLIVVPHLLAFPGVFAAGSIIGGSASAVWLWCFWHGGFALLVSRYALGVGSGPAAAAIPPWRASVPPVRLWRYVLGTAAAVLAISVLSTLGLPLLPQILEGASYARLNHIGLGPFVVFCNVTALVIVLRRLRGGTVLCAWLAVAMTASTIDTILTLYGGGRFTLGWYVARCLSMCTGFTILIALLWEFGSLFTCTIAANHKLHQLSLTDPLTGIPNRRAFEADLLAAWCHAQREQRPVSLLALDVDMFKAFNDRYGHPAGDECLRRVAQTFALTARRGIDSAARIGGEEFAVLLPGTNAAGAAHVAASIHAAMDALALPHADSPSGHVTVSIGIVTTMHAPHDRPAITLLQAADQALYAAKQGGRAQSSIFEDWAKPKPFLSVGVGVLSET